MAHASHACQGLPMLIRSVIWSAALLVLAACGGAGPTGVGPNVLLLRVTPDSTTLARSQQRVFKATPTSGVIPAGSNYVWAVVGAGTVSGAAGDSVRYTAPAADGVDTLTVQVLDGAGAAIAVGATPVRTASGTLLTVALSPVEPRVEVQTGAGTQLFVVTATAGSLPVGGSFAWTVSGSGAPSGRFVGSSATTATTGVNNVTYASPDSVTTDTVKVQVKNAFGAIVGETSTPVIVFPGLRWSNAGANTLWAANNYGNGNYTSPGGTGRIDVNVGGGAEQIACTYQNRFPVRLSFFQQFNVVIYATVNTRLAAGGIYTQGAAASTAPGSLSMPQVAGVNGITLTVSNVLRQSDGSDFVTYTFTTTGNQAGYAGTMSGTGQCVVRYPF